MIEFRNVSKTFQNSWQALREISFAIERGEFVFVIGPSGSGKSTILRMILMDEFPDEGTVRVAEYRSDRIRRPEIPRLRRKLGMIFQDFKLLADRTAYENVAFALEVTGAPTGLIHKKSMAALNEVGLSHKRHCLPFQLSGGEQQKTAIARALVNDPFLLLADEPTGNVDPTGTLEIMQLLRKINAKGTAVLIASHEQELVKKLPFRILTVDGGRLVKDLPSRFMTRRAAAAETT
ncbi:MAG: cell division ATP-binding protein FtsE [Candidatus Edwardsbacteria bacterium]|nr:cell division ATP-binding protein FtsE [Candidatus Edwardsbacteria bacterium]